MTVIFKDLTSFLLQCRSSKLQTPLLLFYQEEIIFKIPQDDFLEFHVDCPVFHMMVLQTLKYKIRIFSFCLCFELAYWIVGTQECREKFSENNLRTQPDPYFRSFNTRYVPGTMGVNDPCQAAYNCNKRI